MKHLWQRVWPPLATAVLYLAAFPPFNLGLLVLVALVPWLLHLPSHSSKGAFKSGYLLGFVIVMEQMAWVPPLVTRWTGNSSIGWLPWLICGILGAFYFATLGWASRICILKGKYWIIPILWAGMEVMRSFIPALAFPWFIISTPLWPYTPLIQNAYYGTMYFVSAWVVLMNIIVLQILQTVAPAKLRLYFGVSLVFVGFSLIRYIAPADGEFVPITIGQPGVDMAFGDKTTNPAEIQASTTAIVDRAKTNGSKLVILPEGLVTESFNDVPAIPFKPVSDIGILIGGRRGTNPLYQSAYGYYNGSWTHADKSRLVVFGEYVPGREWLPFLSSFQLPQGDFTPAQRVESLRVNGYTIGPLICFEAMFYDVSHQQSQNGAQLLAVMSIDDWYMGTPAPEQLMAHTVWRAVETGLPIVRSATLGYTMAVDGRGTIVAQAPLREVTALRTEMQVSKYPQKNPFRPVFPWLASLSWAAFAGWLLLGRRRKSSPA